MSIPGTSKKKWRVQVWSGGAATQKGAIDPFLVVLLALAGGVFCVVLARNFRKRLLQRTARSGVVRYWAARRRRRAVAGASDEHYNDASENVDNDDAESVLYFDGAVGLHRGSPSPREEEAAPSGEGRNENSVSRPGTQTVCVPDRESVREIAIPLPGATRTTGTTSADVCAAPLHLWTLRFAYSLALAAILLNVHFLFKVLHFQQPLFVVAFDLLAANMMVALEMLRSCDDEGNRSCDDETRDVQQNKQSRWTILDGCSSAS